MQWYCALFVELLGSERIIIDEMYICNLLHVILLKGFTVLQLAWLMSVDLVQLVTIVLEVKLDPWSTHVHKATTVPKEQIYPRCVTVDFIKMKLGNPLVKLVSQDITVIRMRTQLEPMVQE